MCVCVAVCASDGLSCAYTPAVTSFVTLEAGSSQMLPAPRKRSRKTLQPGTMHVIHAPFYPPGWQGQSIPFGRLDLPRERKRRKRNLPFVSQHSKAYGLTELTLMQILGIPNSRNRTFPLPPYPPRCSHYTFAEHLVPQKSPSLYKPSRCRNLLHEDILYHIESPFP